MSVKQLSHLDLTTQTLTETAPVSSMGSLILFDVRMRNNATHERVFNFFFTRGFQIGCTVTFPQTAWKCVCVRDVSDGVREKKEEE